MSFLDQASPAFFDAQYRLWQEAPEQLTADWRLFFEGFTLGHATPVTAPAAIAPAQALKEAAVQSLLYRYRDLGHRQACTNPLDPCPLLLPQLRLEAFGLSEADLDTSFTTLRFHRQRATLREILDTLQETYCRSVGVEFMHIQDPEERQWLKEQMEPVRNRLELTSAQQLAVLQKLQKAALFEQFLHRKFLGQKRFSLEGGELLIPLLDHLVNRAQELGIVDLVLGMSHRGRINVLANIFAKPLTTIFAEFTETLQLAFVGDGDVKYHQGFSTDRENAAGQKIHLTLAANPSHLEAVDPVVVGKCRARQSFSGPGGRQKVLPVLIHGEAAFAGQGIVPETLNLSRLDGYQTGGTIHIVINNQIGFTTAPAQARSTTYATDVAKMLAVPIFHLHGEDPEAALFVAGLALDYRQRFAKDVVLEIVCYRRHGHNEGDDPSFTQPLLYAKIDPRPTVDAVYAERLAAAGVDPEKIEESARAIGDQLEQALGQSAGRQDTGYQSKWQGMQREAGTVEVSTGIKEALLLDLARRISAIPPAFHPHPKIAKLLDKRREAVEQDSGIDWGTAEALAFASLLQEGIPVRLSGQDSRRGTFNQRHSFLVDHQSGQLHVPLAFVAAGQAPIQICDSMLSEAAVLGFEYGYSLEMPGGLTLWEAQFGDFANGAQVIIDQFIASSQTKWDRASGLVLLLPHGFEGNGAEHSSARIERFLQLCAADNLQVVYPSTPAQLFHLLRRQVKLPYRRPLIVFTPKSLLRHPACVSRRAEFCFGGFQEILPAATAAKEVSTLLLCSGKIYYELLERQQKEERPDVAIVRIEQLYPLRNDPLVSACAPYRAARRLAWVQEEPHNNGAWPWLRPQLTALLGREVEYIGRPAAAAPAVGSHHLHQQEQEEILNAAFAAG
jgi:2-oxoglutarate dehydrogenase E1 component